MNKLMKYTLVTIAGYATINWAADNPAKVKLIRNEINTVADEGYTVVRAELKSFKDEVKTQ